MKRYNTIITILLLSMCVLSCHKDTTKPNTLSSEYFPNSIGDYWEYDVYDSSSVRQHSDFPRRYTVKVSVIGIQKLVDNKNAYVWQYHYPWGNELKYVRISMDTIKVYDQDYSKTIRDLRFPREIYIIPFYNKQSWKGKLLVIDSSYVTSQKVITTESKEFNNGFNIYHHYIGPNTEYNDTSWFVPNIGIVKIYYNRFNFAPRNKYLWQLKKYYLR